VRPAIPASAMVLRPMSTATRWVCCGRVSARTAPGCPVPRATISTAWSGTCYRRAVPPAIRHPSTSRRPGQTRTASTAMPQQESR
jgi:hypothetical protein